jgi:hypothetical protein
MFLYYFYTKERQKSRNRREKTAKKINHKKIRKLHESAGFQTGRL